MKFFTIFCIFFGVSCMLGIIHGVRAQVVFSEINWVGTDISTADEWMEFASVVSDPVNISGWKITSLSGSGEEKEMLVFPQDITIQPYEYFLVSNFSAAESRLASIPKIITTAVSILNTKLMLRIYNASGSLIDQADDGTGVPFAGGKTASGIYTSMERKDLFGPGDYPNNWKDASESRGLDENAPVLGTPSFPNSIDGSSECSSSVSSFYSSTSSQSSISSILSLSSFSGSSLSSISSFASSSAESPPALPNIIISEVLANPEGADDNEWIEIANMGSGSVSIAGWKLNVGSNNFVISDENSLLNANDVLVFYKNETGLSLKNNGDIITLWSGSTIINQLEYPQTAENVSYGKIEDSYMPLCFPTPGTLNKKFDQEMFIYIQSGKEVDREKVTINVEAQARNGKMNWVECEWYFTDGFWSDNCNPPSHTFEDVGRFSIEFYATNICGDEMSDILNGEVLAKKSSSSSSSSVSSSSLSSSSKSFSSFSESSTSNIAYKNEVIISEIYPSPNSGEEEWIELFNPYPHTVNLTRWTLDDIKDGGSKPWTISQDKGEIPPLSFKVFYKKDTGLSLNNNGDDVVLLSPDGSTGSVISFPKIKKGMSYAADLLCISNTPTPGSVNVCDLGSSSSSEKIKNSSSVSAGLSVVKNKTIYKNDLPSFLKSKYVNVFPEEEKKAESGSFSWFAENFGGNIIAQPKNLNMQTGDNSPYLGFLFYLLFLGLGWWFVFLGKKGERKENNEENEPTLSQP